eukprot:403361250
MSQRYYKKEAKIAQPTKKREAKSVQKLNSKAEYSKKIEQPSPEKSQLGSATKKRRWIQEFTVKHGPTNLKRRRIFVDLIELQHYSGMALFKNELDMLSDKEPFFHPKFSHQIFHKDETVRGFKNLTIDIFLTPATLRPFLNVNFEKQAKNHDEIESTLSKHFGEDGLIKTRKQFLDAVKDEETKFKPLGKKVGSFIRQMPIQDNDLLNLMDKKEKRSSSKMKQQLENVQFDIYKIEADHNKFSEINRRLQAMLIFYIDGASFISVDKDWSYFLVYQGPNLVAYSTVYEQKRPLNMGKSKELQKNPCKTIRQKEIQKTLSATKYTYKLRISQFLVLPPYQRLGVGSVLLEQMYNFYLVDKKCVEITVEDPSHDFQIMKDALDIKLIWKNGFFEAFRNMFKGKNSLKSSNINKFNFDQLVLDQQEISNIQSLLKLKKQNILRCFELLILAKLDTKDPVVHQKFAQEVKRKFYYQMNKNLLQPYFQLENFYGNIISSSQQTHEELNPVKKEQIKCCDGFGKVITDEQFENFEQSLSKNRHHFYNEGGNNDQENHKESQSATRHHVLEYQRSYNKFTPTPMPQIGLINGFAASQHYGGGNGYNQLVATKFELPDGLRQKILKIISSD